MSFIYLKCLSGDITPISLSTVAPLLSGRPTLPSEEPPATTPSVRPPVAPLPSDIDIWNRISSIVASKYECKNPNQVVIFDETDDQTIPPKIIPEKQYNFFIRDEDYFTREFLIGITYSEGSGETVGLPEGSGEYTRYLIRILSKTCAQPDIYFNIYEKFGLFYYKKIDEESFFSMYSLLEKILNTFPFPWYDKGEIINRIMQQYDEIQRIMKQYDEIHNILP